MSLYAALGLKGNNWFSKGILFVLYQFFEEPRRTVVGSVDIVTIVRMAYV